MTDFLRRIVNAQTWQQHAACRGSDLDVWFPGRGDIHASNLAKKICNGDKDTTGCPVRAECLAYALDNDIDHGVYGGRSVRERRAMKSTRRRTT